MLKAWLFIAAIYLGHSEAGHKKPRVIQTTQAINPGSFALHGAAGRPQGLSYWLPNVLSWPCETTVMVYITTTGGRFKLSSS